MWTEGMPLRLVGVGLSGFGEKAVRPQQLGLFDEKAPGGHEMRDRSALLKGYGLAARPLWRRGPGLWTRLRLRDRVSDTAPMHKDEA